MSDTPRTDAESHVPHGEDNTPCVETSFARQLEHELKAARQRIEQLAGANDELNIQASRQAERIAELEAKNRDGAKLAWAAFQSLEEMGFTKGETLGEFIDRISATTNAVAAAQIAAKVCREDAEANATRAEKAEVSLAAEQQAHLATRRALVALCDSLSPLADSFELPVNVYSKYTAARAAVAQADHVGEPNEMMQASHAKPRTCNECANFGKGDCEDLAYHNNPAPAACFQPRADAQKGSAK